MVHSAKTEVCARYFYQGKIQMLSPKLLFTLYRLSFITCMNEEWSSVILFKPLYQLCHPENNLFFISKQMFTGSNYPHKKMFLLNTRALVVLGRSGTVLLR